MRRAGRASGFPAEPAAPQKQGHSRARTSLRLSTPGGAEGPRLRGNNVHVQKANPCAPSVRGDHKRGTRDERCDHRPVTTKNVKKKKKNLGPKPRCLAGILVATSVFTLPSLGLPSAPRPPSPLLGPVPGLSLPRTPIPASSSCCELPATELSPCSGARCPRGGRAPPAPHTPALGNLQAKVTGANSSAPLSM